MMAEAARGLVLVEKFKHDQWEKLPGEDQQRYKDYSNRHLYNVPVREDFVEKAANFAEWADKSSGFKIC